MYRSYNLLHLEILDLVNQNQSLSILITLVYVIIITTYFVAFRSENTVFCIITFVIGSALSGCLSIVFKLAYSITKYSGEFLHNFVSISQGRDAAKNRRFFKSCKPLYVNFGDYSRISRNMFPSVMHEIIIGSIISLLLAIPN